MKTQTYAYVLQRAVELTGRTYPPSVEEATIFRGFIAQALRKIWELFPWPETLSYSKEFFGEIYDSTTTFSAGDFVYWGQENAYYQALRSTSGVAPTDASGVLNASRWIEVDDNYSEDDWDSATTYTVGDVVIYHPTESLYALHTSAPVGTAPTNTTYWGQVNTFVRTVDKYLNKDGSTRSSEIGEVFAAYATDPRTSYYKKELDYEILGDTILFRACNYAWLHYRSVPPSLSSDPSTIPYRFCEYVATKAASMALAVEGKLDLSAIMNQQAEEFASVECDKANTQEQQTRQTKVISR